MVPREPHATHGCVWWCGVRGNIPAETEQARFTVSGLRRYLIIFDPHTLVLDWRMRSSRAPSLPRVPHRSENFTSVAPIHRARGHSHGYRSALGQGMQEEETANGAGRLPYPPLAHARAHTTDVCVRAWREGCVAPTRHRDCILLWLHPSQYRIVQQRWRLPPEGGPLRSLIEVQTPTETGFGMPVVVFSFQSSPRLVGWLAGWLAAKYATTTTTTVLFFSSFGRSLVIPHLSIQPYGGRDPNREEDPPGAVRLPAALDALCCLR